MTTRASDPGEETRRESGITRKSSPGAYSLTPVQGDVATALALRIEAIKKYHEARVRLDMLASELANADAKHILPGVTHVYVKAMGDCLQILSMYADEAEGL